MPPMGAESCRGTFGWDGMAGPIGDDGRVQLTVETEARDTAQLRISVFGRRTEKRPWLLNMPPSSSSRMVGRTAQFCKRL